MGVKGRLELFQKFIDNGTDGRPLVAVHACCDLDSFDKLDGLENQ